MDDRRDKPHPERNFLMIEAVNTVLLVAVLYNLWVIKSKVELIEEEVEDISTDVLSMTVKEKRKNEHV